MGYTDQINNTQPASGGGSSSSSRTADPSLFLGLTKGLVRNGPTQELGDIGGETVTGPSIQQGKVPNITTQSQAQALWYSWTQADRLAWAKRAYALGYLQSPTDVQGAQQLWMSAIDESVRYYGVKKNVSPWQVLDINAGSNADTLKKRGQLSADGSITHTNSQIDLSDKASVEALATQVLQQALGRDPTSSEINTYYNTIRGQEKAHPTVTTSRTDASGNTSTTSTGGFSQADAGQYLLDRLKTDPEYAKFQAGTTYFQAAMQALAPIAGA